MIFWRGNYFLVSLIMYILDQVKKQFSLWVISYVGEAPEGPGEQVSASKSETQTLPDDPAEAVGELAQKAEEVTAQTDARLSTERERGLVGAEVPASLRTQVESGEAVDLASPEVMRLAKDTGLEHVVKEAQVDAMGEGETATEWVESSAAELQGSLDAIGAEQQAITDQINDLPAGSPERQALEQRQSFLQSLYNSVEWIMTGAEISGEGALGVAQQYLWIHEDSGEADQFLMWMAQSARETPWCAGFVSFVCKQAGYDVKPTLSSRALIGQEWKGHTAFNVWNGQMLGGNQSNTVSVVNIKKDVEGWVMPEDIWNKNKTYTRENGNIPPNGAGKDMFDPNNIPVGAVLVFGRSESNSTEK